MNAAPFSRLFRPVGWLIRLLRRNLRRLVFWTLLSSALLLCAALFVLNSPAAVTWALDWGLPRLNERLPGAISVEQGSGTLGDRLRLDRVVVQDDRGTVVASVERIELSWQPWDLLAGQISVAELTLKDPSVLLDRRADGRLGLVASFSSGQADDKERGARQPRSAPIDISLESLSLSGGRLLWTEQGSPRLDLEAIEGEGSWSWRGQDQDLALRSLQLSPKVPELTQPLVLRGGAQLNGLELSVDQLEARWARSSLVLSGPLGFLSSIELDLKVGIELDGADLATLWPTSPLEGSYSADLRLSGRPDQLLAVGGDLRSSVGGRVLIEGARVDLNLNSEEPTKHQGTLIFEEVGLGEILGRIRPLPDRVHGRLDWDGAGSTVADLSGTYSLDLSAFKLLHVAVDRLEARGTLRGPSIKVGSGALRFGEGTVDLSGEVDLSARSYFLEATAAQLELGAFRRASADWLRGGLADFGGFARGTWGGGHKVSVTTSGQGSLTDPRLGGARLRSVSADWDFSLLLAASGGLELDGSFDADARGVALGGGTPLRRVQLDALFQQRGARYRLRASRGSDLLLTTTGHLDWTRYPTLRFEGKKLELQAGEQRVESDGAFDLKIRKGSLQLDHLSLKSATGTMFVQGSYNPGLGEMAANLRLRGLDLGELPALSRALSGREWSVEQPRGRVDELFLRGTGRLSDPVLSLRATGSALGLGDRPPFDLAAELEVSEGILSGEVAVDDVVRLGLTKMPLVLRLDRAAAPFEIPTEASWDVELDLPDQDCSHLAALLGLSLPPEVDAGRLTGNVRWGGSAAVPQMRAVASLTGVQAAGRSINAQLGWTMEGDVIELGLTRLKTAAEGTILHLEGGARVPFGDYLMSRWGPPRARRPGVDPYLEDIAVTVVLDKVDMSLVHLIEPALEPMTGLLRGKVQFTGRADQPSLGAELQLLGARIGGRDLHPIELTADLMEDRLRGDFTLRPREGGALRARSEVTFPLRLQPLPSRDVLLGSEDLIAEVSGEGFPLDVLLAFVPGLSDEAGSLTLSGSVTGSLLRPRPDLEFGVEGGRACARSLGICYANVLLASSLKSERFDITELWADTVPQVVNPIDIVRGRVRPAQRSGIGLKGSIGLDGWRPDDVELQLTLAQPWLIYSREIQVQVDGEMGVRGTYPALAVSGDLDVQNVEIDLGQDTIGREVEQLTLPASLRVHRRSSLPGPGERKLGQAEAEQGLAFLEDLRGAASARVALHLTNNVNVSLAVGVAGQGGAAQAANLLGSVEPELILGGDLELLWDQGKGGAVGEIRTEKGSKLTVLTRPFAVEEGSSVEFVGAIPDAQLAIRALQQSGQGEVAVVVSGQIGAPQIDFESDEFEDPADVMSVLLTGKPLSELSAAEGGSALGQITETLAGFGTRAFGKYVPVDRLALDIGDDISSGSVEAGKALSPWLFFLTRFRWGAEDDENRVEGQLEFRFDRRGYVEVRMGDRLIGSADVVWKIQF